MPYTTLKYTYPSLMEQMQRVSDETLLYDKPLSYGIYENATLFAAKANGFILMGGVKSQEGEMVKGTGINSYMENLYDCDEANIEFVDEDVIYIGYLIHCYGHVITDCLKHAWFVNSGFFQAHKNRKMVYTVCGDLKPWHVEIFSLAGIDLKQCIKINTPTKFRSVLVPDPSFIDMNIHDKPEDSSYAKPFYTKEYLQTIDEVVKNALLIEPPVKNDKLYFSRASKSRDIRSVAEQYGETHVCKYVRKCGFKVVYPASLSIAKQIAYLQGCKVFMTTDGSIAHNALFLPQGTETVILRKNLRINAYTGAIIAARSLNACVIDCSLSVLNKGIEPFFGPFFIYANSFLSEYLGIDRPMFPFSKFRKYLSSICEYPDISERLVFAGQYREILSNEIKHAAAAIKGNIDKFMPFSNTAIGKKIAKRLVSSCMKWLLS